MVTVGAVAVESAIALTAGTVVAAYVAPFLAGMVFATTSFCQNPPPAMPTMSAQDFLDLANIGNHAVQVAALTKLQQWFTAQYWYQLCDCVNAATPAAPAPTPLPPLGGSPGLPPAVMQGPCWNASTTSTMAPQNYSIATYQVHDLTPGLLPANPPTANWTQSGAYTTPIVMQTIPPGVQRIILTGTMHPPGVADQGCQIDLVTAGAGINLMDDMNLLWQTSGPVSGTLTATLATPNASALYWGVVGLNTDRVNTNTLDVNVTFDCGPLGLNTPCCPPDPLVQQYLQMIFSTEQNILQLLQGLGGPGGAFTPGTTHTGLSGNGTLVFTGAPRALRVDVTSPTTSFIMNPGSPDYFFSMGFITSYAQTYPLKGWRLVYTGQVYPLHPQATEVGWTLPPGLVINITELL